MSMSYLIFLNSVMFSLLSFEDYIKSKVDTLSAVWVFLGLGEFKITGLVQLQVMDDILDPGHRLPSVQSPCINRPS